MKKNGFTSSKFYLKLAIFLKLFNFRYFVIINNEIKNSFNTANFINL